VTDRSRKKESQAAEEQQKAADTVDGQEASEQVEETSPLQEAERKASEYLDMAKRIQADFDNYRKRVQKDNEDFRRFANESMVSELLCILDDIERALALECADKEFYGGLKGIHINLMKMLEAKGLRPINTEGKFDPNLHEALCTCEGEDNGKIMEVYQKGYYLGPRVLRHAKVLVSKNNNNKEGE